MKPTIRIMAIVLLLFAAGLLAASIGLVMPRGFSVAGPTGAPTRAWAAYTYEGTRFNFVDSLSWTRKGGIVDSGPGGGLRLPFLLYAKAPMDGWLAHDIQLVHAPALHSTIHERHPADGAVLEMPDNSADPQAWMHTLDEIYSLVAYQIAFAENSPYVITPGMAEELARRVVDDYRVLLATHGDRRRDLPSEIPGHLQFASEQDRKDWRARMRQEIEREPTWGMYLKRRYAGRIAELEEQFGL